MRSEKKTEFVDQLEKLFNKFSARLKDFKSYEYLFEIFSSPFYTDIDTAPTDIQMELIDIKERTNLKAKYVEMNLVDFYRKSLDQDKFPKKIYELLKWHFLAQLICVNNFCLKWVS